MEIIMCFFRNLFVIIALFIPCILVVVVKVLVWIARRLYGCVRRVFEFFNACTAAMQRTEPTITIRTRGNGVVPIISGNVKNRRVKTTNQNKKMKKPYKEKQEIVAIPVPFNGMKHARAAGRISSKDNFHRTEKVAPSTTRSLWGPYSDVKNQKGRNYNQDRNSGRIKHPLSLKPQVFEEHVVRKDVAKAASSSNSTRTYSDLRNKKGSNFSLSLSNHHDQRNEILKVKSQADEERNLRNDRFRKAEKVAPTARITQHHVRLWSRSVDINVETAIPASDIQQPDCYERNENNAPGSAAAKDLEDITMQPAANRETDKFSCNSILLTVANAMAEVVLGVVKPVCSYVKAQVVKIERNQSIKICSCFLMAVANEMVGVVLGVVKPVCSYVKAQLANIGRSQRIKICSCFLMNVADAMVGVVSGVVKPVYSYVKAQLANTERNRRIDQCVILGAVQPLCENSNQHQEQNGKGSKGVRFRILWRAIRTLYGPITSAITAAKLKLQAFTLRVQLTFSRLRVNKQDNTSQEITPAFSNISKDLKGNKTAVVHNAHQAMSTTESVALAAGQSCITNPSTPKREGILLTSQQGHHSQLLDVLQNPANENDNIPAPQNSGANLHPQTNKPSQRQQQSRHSKEQMQMNSPSNVGHAHMSGPGEMRVKASTILPSSMDGTARVTVGRRKKPKKVVNLPTTPSVACNRNEKVMPRLIPPSYVNLIARAKAHVQGMSSPRVGLSNLIMPAKVNEESQLSGADNIDNSSSAKRQEVIQHAVSRQKRRNTEQELISTDVQASKSFISQCRLTTAVTTAPTEVMQRPFEMININSRPRENIKRRTECDAGIGLKYELIALNPALRTGQVTAQKSGEGKLEQPELMEVGESADKPFNVTRSEEMEISQESSAVTTEAPTYKLQALSTSIFTAPVKSTLTNASSNAKLETEEMETVPEKASVWNFFSFTLPSFLAAPFSLQPLEEEMDVDQQTVSVTPSNAEQEEMDINQQPFAMATPFGQHKNAKWPVLAAGIRRPEAACTLPQQETMEISQQLFHTSRPVARPFAELVDAVKRPFASTVGMFGEAAIPVKITTAGQHMQPVIQQAMQPAMQQAIHSVVQQVTQPVLGMQPVVQPVMHSVMQPAMQTVMQPPVAQPAMRPTVESKMPAKLLNPGTLLQIQHPQVNSAMESRINNASSKGQPCVRELTMTGQTLTSEVRGQEATSKSRDQLIMEQLQLVPPTDPACYLPDDSDSDSEDDSDDEYELDLETIEKFSDLESSPDHAQFITTLLAEKEATRWHDISDSDSDSDCGDKHELSELLDSEIIAQYSELEDDVEVLEKLLAERESSFHQCNM